MFTYFKQLHLLKKIVLSKYRKKLFSPQLIEKVIRVEQYMSKIYP